MALPQDGEVRTVRLLEAIADKFGVVPDYLSPDGGQRTLQLTEALARRFGFLPPLPPDEPTVPTVTKSIGTSSRDYSTMTSWEADLDNTTPYDAGDDAVGECYDDSAFDESFTINGGGTIGLASRTLSVASTDRHDGTAGVGARIVRSAGYTGSHVSGGIANTLIEWLEFDGSAGTGTTATYGFRTAFAGSGQRFKNLICHHVKATHVTQGITSISANGGDVMGCVVYDIESTGGSSRSAGGIYVGTGSSSDQAYNCTVHNTKKTGGTGSALGIEGNSDADTRVINCVATGSTNTTGGAATDITTPAGGSYNASSDASATGTGSLTSIVTADQFVSIVGGSEDLHLKSGADCIDAGTDLVTTPTGVNIDIDGYDRDAAAVTWDIGAHEYVASGVVGNLIGGRLVGRGGMLVFGGRLTR